jgi:hypothetical protein
MLVVALSGSQRNGFRGAPLKKGRRSEEFSVRLLSEDEKPEILKSYLDRYKLTVQRYFPLPAGSSTDAFRPLTGDYPAFELVSLR